MKISFVPNIYVCNFSLFVIILPSIIQNIFAFEDLSSNGNSEPFQRDIC